MTYGVLKANALGPEIVTNGFREKYHCIAQLCEDNRNTAGLVYHLNDILAFYMQHNALPGTIEEPTPSSLADAVNEIYAQCAPEVLVIVQAHFPRRFPLVLTETYTLYELWALRAHARGLSRDLRLEVRRGEN